MRPLIITLGMLLLGVSINAKADTFSFSNLSAGATAFPASAGPENITEGLATFHGGTILTAETFASDAGNVYATVSNSIVPSTFTFLNPITITFSQAVSNLSLTVVNNDADTYFLTDNNGDSTSAALGFNLTNGILTLNDTNILSATLGVAGPNWDFALSGGSYNTSGPSGPTSPTPEPSTLIMLGTGLVGLAGVARRKLLV